jgi:hypothetical protein
MFIDQFLDIDIRIVRRQEYDSRHQELVVPAIVLQPVAGLGLVF